MGSDLLLWLIGICAVASIGGASISYFVIYACDKGYAVPMILAFTIIVFIFLELISLEWFQEAVGT